MSRAISTFQKFIYSEKFKTQLKIYDIVGYKQCGCLPPKRACFMSSIHSDPSAAVVALLMTRLLSFVVPHKSGKIEMIIHPVVTFVASVLPCGGARAQSKTRVHALHSP